MKITALRYAVAAMVTLLLGGTMSAQVNVSGSTLSVSGTTMNSASYGFQVGNGTLLLDTDAAGTPAGTSSTINSGGIGIWVPFASGTVFAANTTVNATSGQAVNVVNGSFVSVYNGQLSSQSSHGIYADSFGTKVVLNQTDIVAGFYGAWVLNGATLFINTDTTGVATGLSSTLTSVNDGLYLNGGSVAAANLSIIAGGRGVAVVNGGKFNGNYLTISSTGAYGVEANGANSRMDLYNSTVQSAQDGIGLIGTNQVHTVQGGSVNAIKRGVVIDGAIAGISYYTVTSGSHGISVLNGSAAYLTGVNITTTGADGYGLYIANGGQVFLDGTYKPTIMTQGNGSHGVVLEGPSSFINDLGNMSITTSGSGAHGFVVGQGASWTFDMVNEMTDLTLNVTGQNSALAAAVGNGSLLTLSAISVDRFGDGVVALAAENSGTLSIHNTLISTQGNDSAAVLIKNAYLDANGDTLQTQGDRSYGILMDGGVATIAGSGFGIKTSGNAAHGIMAINGAQATFDGVTSQLPQFDISGQDSVLMAINGVGSSITLDGVTLANTAQADGVHGVLASNGGNITVQNGATVLTEANDAAAVYLLDGGSITFNSGTLATTGDRGYGLVIDGASAVSILGTDGHIVTQGEEAHGILLKNGANASLMSNVSVEVHGADSALVALTDSSTFTITASTLSGTADDIIGVLVGDESRIQVQNFGVVSLTGSNVTGIKADGNNASVYIDVASTVQVDGDGSKAVSLGSTSTADIDSSFINAYGENARAIDADNATLLVGQHSGITTISATGASAVGVYATNDTDILAQNAIVSVTGSGATALYLKDNGSSVTWGGGWSDLNADGTDAVGVLLDHSDATFSNLAAIRASGSNATALVVNDSTVTLQNVPVIATGDEAKGVVFSGPAASGTLMNGSITVSGSAARAVVAEDGAQVSLVWYAPTMSVRGRDSAFLEAKGDGSQISFEGPHQYDDISQPEPYAYGFLATDGGKTIIGDGASLVAWAMRGIDVTMAYASGFGASGAPAEIVFNKTNLFQSGGANNDHSQAGLYADVGGKISFNNSVIVDWNHRNRLAYAAADGTIEINNSTLATYNGVTNRVLFADGAGALITANNASVSADIQVNSYYNIDDGQYGQIILSASNTPVINPGDQGSYGIYAINAGTVTFDNGSILTGGNHSIGVRAETAGVVNIANSKIETYGDAAYAMAAENATINGANLEIITHGEEVGGGFNIVAAGVVAEYSGHVSIVDVAGNPATTITTYGDTAVGAIAQVTGTHAPTTLTLIGDSAQPMQIQTIGDHAYGVEIVTLNDSVGLPVSQVTFGMVTSSSSQAIASGTLQNVAINTTGSGALGVYGLGSLAYLDMLGLSVETAGADAHGIGMSAGATGVLASSTITTHGDLTAGVALSGSNSNVAFTDAAVDIITTGSGAHGIWALQGAQTTIDGAASILPNITVNGVGAAVLAASGADSAITLAGDSALNPAMTAGSETWGVKVEDGATVTFADTASSGSTGLWATNGGTLAFADSAMGNGSRVVIDTTAALNLSTVNPVSGVTIGSLEGAGLVSFGANAAALTIDGDLSTVFSGTINGDGSLIKAGLSTLSLSGTNAFAYTGDTVINHGVLAIRNFDLTATETFDKVITLNGGWLDLSDVTFTGSDSWQNLVIASGSNAAAGGVIGVGDRLFFNIASGSTVTADYQIGGSGTTQGIYLEKAGQGTLVLTGSNTYVGNTRILGGVVQISQDSNLGETTLIAPREIILNTGTLAVTANLATTRRIELDGTGGALDIAASTTTTWAGVISGSSTASFAKNGTGTLVLTGNNTYAGMTTVNAGVLQIGAGGNIGSIAGDITNNAKLIFNRSDDITYGKKISGTGALVKQGAGALTLTSTNTAGSVSVDAGTLRLAAGSLLTASTATVAPSATLDLAGALTAKVTNSGTILVSNAAATGATITVTGDLANNGIVDFTKAASAAYNTLRITGNYSGAGSTLLRANLGALTSDKLLINGAATGTQKIGLSLAPNSPLALNTALWLVQTDAGPAASNAFALDNNGKDYVESGVLTLRLYQGDGGTIMPDYNRWYLAAADKRSNAADVIVSTASIIAAEWLYDLDNIHKRMGDIRAEINPSTEELTGNVWVRTNGYRLNADASLGGAPFREYVYGLTVGGDKGWRRDRSIFLVGGILGAGHVDRTFDNNVGDGNTSILTAGFYGTWIHDDGWYADFVANIQRYDNEFNARAIDGHISTGDYDSMVKGLSLEVGRRIGRKDGWWVEPFAQIAAGWIDSDSYTTSTGVAVDIDDSDHMQYRFMVRTGRENLFWKGFHPYAKLGAAKVDGSGTTIHAGGLRTFTSDIDGWRFEAGIGTSYTIDNKSQLYFDYEYNKAPNYERPWNLNFGYRRLW